jgi:pimeloyl-ACP methyl ester carboxylesterase
MTISRHIPSLLALLVAGLALGVYMTLPIFPGLNKRLGTAPYLPWHANDAWKRMLKAIDEVAKVQFSDCDSKLVETSFGKTQIYACGNSHHPPIMLFHGAASTSTMWGNWMTPALVQENKYAIMVDFICDTGRSIPKDFDPANCPSTEEDIAEWVEEIANGLHLKTPVTLLGLSYGALVSFLTALHKPKLVNQLILLAPAGVLFEISNVWLLQWLLYRAYPTNFTQNWFYNKLTANMTWFDMLDTLKLEQEQAMRDLGCTTLTVSGKSFPDDKLREVFEGHSTFFGIGDQDVVSPDPVAAAKRAKDNGASQVVVYPKAGHALSERPTQEYVVRDVVGFLKREAGVIESEVLTAWE